ncbi:hypothetical protein FGIG_05692 [Fasciola gigantica]|uniref:Uncharacterized protein n=1 Tax=Fasciola gigantica TaxID=46835 RepID=A0A504YWL6_FASGI|nr:hypothetical protein FGIG_05692 [Fasciola gigantica]
MPVNNGTLTNKLNVSKQILINQQLDSHYKRIQNVRATIDTSIPYTFTRNPTTRGYRTQKRSPRPGLTVTLHSDDVGESFMMPERFSDDQVVDNIVKEFLKENPIFFQSDPNDEWHDASEREKGKAIASVRNNRDRSGIARSAAGSSRSAFGSRPASSGGDVLKRFQHKFTKEKPFSPRTMKTNAESKIRRLRCYNPPIRARRSSTSTERQSSRPSSAGETHLETNNPPGQPSSLRPFRPTSRPSPRIVNLARRTSSPVTAESVRNSNLSDHRGARVTVVPGFRAVDDSRTDEPAAELQPVTSVVVTQAPGSRTPANVNDSQMGKVDRWLDTLPESNIPTRDTKQVGEQVKEPTAFDTVLMTPKPSAVSKTTDTDSSQDDICYLSFIEAVTTDALTRGVFTDRNLNWLLDEHATRNEFGLTQEQLQQATDHLRNQLKISDDTPSTTPLRISSSSWTTAASTEGQGVLPRTTLSEDTNESVPLGSSGTTVPAKVVLTSMRPPPAPTRTGSAMGGSHRSAIANSRVAGTITSTTKSPEGLRKSQEATGDTIEPRCTVLSETPHVTWNEQSIDRTDATAPVVQPGGLFPSMEHEDTLIDQVTIPNLSYSAHNTDESDIPEASPPESDSDMEGFDSTPTGHRSPDDHNTANAETPSPRQPRVKFAPKPEIFLSRPSDLTTSASSLTDLTQLSSGEAHNSSIPEAEPDISSVQAIAEGDSNFSFEMTVSPKGVAPVVPVEDQISPRANS